MYLESLYLHLLEAFCLLIGKKKKKKAVEKVALTILSYKEG